MVAADARTAITFSLSPGHDHDAPHGRLSGHLKSGQWWSPENRPMRTWSGQAIVLACRDRFSKVDFVTARESASQAGDTQGGGSPSCGGSRRRDVPAGFAGAARVASWGEPERLGKQ